MRRGGAGTSWYLPVVVLLYEDQRELRQRQRPACSGTTARLAGERRLRRGRHHPVQLESRRRNRGERLQGVAWQLHQPDILRVYDGSRREDPGPGRRGDGTAGGRELLLARR